MIEFTHGGKRRLQWFSLIVSSGLAVFCFLGAVMSGSLSVACDPSLPQRCANWQRAGVYYEAMAAIWLAAAVASAIGLIRGRRASGSLSKL